MKRVLTLLLCLTPITAIAACPKGEALVFSCRTQSAKEVRVCQAPSVITYRFGKPGKPAELTISENNNAFVWEQAQGVSSGVGSDLTFTNDSAEYVISHIANFDDPTDSSAYLAVKQPGTDDVYIQCTSGIRFNAKAIKAQAREMTERPASAL